MENMRQKKKIKYEPKCQACRKFDSELASA